MTSRLLGEELDGLRNRSDVWHFVNSHRDVQLKLRLDLTEEDGYDFCYDNFEQTEIMNDRTVTEMISLYQEWQNQFPYLYDVVTMVMGDFATPDANSDQNFVDVYVDEIERNLKMIGLYERDLDITLEMLLDLGRDMYNYLSYAIVNSNMLSSNERILEFLKCQEAYFDGNKLYITLAIYEENLKYLEICIDEAEEEDLVDPYTDADLVEIVNGIRELIKRLTISAAQRKVRNRNWDRRPSTRLLS